MVDLERDEFPFGEEGFDDLPINPYEVVIAAAKKARDINNKVQKYVNPELKVKPMGLAMQKLLDKDVRFEYVEEKNSDDQQSKSEE